MSTTNTEALPAEETDQLLAAWAPISAPDFHPWTAEPDEAYAPEVVAFFDAARSPALLHSDYQSLNPRAMLDDWRLLDAAEPDQIRALLTFMVRSERFCDGARGEFIANGEAGAFMRRIREIRSAATGSHATLRLVSWNMRCQTRLRPIPAACVPALRSWVPDVVILNEYVHDSTRAGLVDDLSRIGLVHVACSERIGRHNQVLIASRVPLDIGDLQGPDLEGGAGKSNFLHVRLGRLDLSVVGLRVPTYTGEALQRYWDDVSRSVRSRTLRSIWIGDLNCDPDRPRSSGGRALKALEAEGFQIPRPADPWSFHTGSRIDHAVLSPDLKFVSARYLSHAGGHLVVGVEPEHVTDHAAVFVEIDAR